MQQIVGVTELQRRFRSFFDQVVKKRTPLVLIPYDEYLRYQELRESEVLARFDQVWSRLAALNAEFSAEEIAADIEAARSEL